MSASDASIIYVNVVRRVVEEVALLANEQAAEAAALSDALRTACDKAADAAVAEVLNAGTSSTNTRGNSANTAAWDVEEGSTAAASSDPRNSRERPPLPSALPPSEAEALVRAPFRRLSASLQRAAVGQAQTELLLTLVGSFEESPIYDVLSTSVTTTTTPAVLGSAGEGTAMAASTTTTTSATPHALTTAGRLMSLAHGANALGVSRYFQRLGAVEASSATGAASSPSVARQIERRARDQQSQGNEPNADGVGVVPSAKSEAAATVVATDSSPSDAPLFLAIFIAAQVAPRLLRAVDALFFFQPKDAAGTSSSGGINGLSTATIGEVFASHPTALRGYCGLLRRAGGLGGEGSAGGSGVAPATVPPAFWHSTAMGVLAAHRTALASGSGALLIRPALQPSAVAPLGSAFEEEQRHTAQCVLRYALAAYGECLKASAAAGSASSSSASSALLMASELFTAFMRHLSHGLDMSAPGMPLLLSGDVAAARGALAKDVAALSRFQQKEAEALVENESRESPTSSSSSSVTTVSTTTVLGHGSLLAHQLFALFGSRWSRPIFGSSSALTPQTFVTARDLALLIGGAFSTAEMTIVPAARLPTTAVGHLAPTAPTHQQQQQHSATSASPLAEESPHYRQLLAAVARLPTLDTWLAAPTSAVAVADTDNPMPIIPYADIVERTDAVAAALERVAGGPILPPTANAFASEVSPSASLSYHYVSVDERMKRRKHVTLPSSSSAIEGGAVLSVDAPVTLSSTHFAASLSALVAIGRPREALAFFLRCADHSGPALLPEAVLAVLTAASMRLGGNPRIVLATSVTEEKAAIVENHGECENLAEQAPQGDSAAPATATATVTEEDESAVDPSLRPAFVLRPIAEKPHGASASSPSSSAQSTTTTITLDEVEAIVGAVLERSITYSPFALGHATPAASSSTSSAAPSGPKLKALGIALQLLAALETTVAAQAKAMSAAIKQQQPAQQSHFSTAAEFIVAAERRYSLKAAADAEAMRRLSAVARRAESVADALTRRLIAELGALMSGELQLLTALLSSATKATEHVASMISEDPILSFLDRSVKRRVWALFGTAPSYVHDLTSHRIAGAGDDEASRALDAALGEYETICALLARLEAPHIFGGASVVATEGSSHHHHHRHQHSAAVLATSHAVAFAPFDVYFARFASNRAFDDPLGVRDASSSSSAQWGASVATALGEDDNDHHHRSGQQQQQRLPRHVQQARDRKGSASHLFSGQSEQTSVDLVRRRADHLARLCRVQRSVLLTGAGGTMMASKGIETLTREVTLFMRRTQRQRTPAITDVIMRCAAACLELIASAAPQPILTPQTTMNALRLGRSLRFHNVAVPTALLSHSSVVGWYTYSCRADKNIFKGDGDGSDASIGNNTGDGPIVAIASTAYRHSARLKPQPLLYGRPLGPRDAAATEVNMLQYLFHEYILPTSAVIDPLAPSVASAAAQASPSRSNSNALTTAQQRLRLLETSLATASRTGGSSAAAAHSSDNSRNIGSRGGKGSHLSPAAIIQSAAVGSGVGGVGGSFRYDGRLADLYAPAEEILAFYCASADQRALAHMLEWYYSTAPLETASAAVTTAAGALEASSPHSPSCEGVSSETSSSSSIVGDAPLHVNGTISWRKAVAIIFEGIVPRYRVAAERSAAEAKARRKAEEEKRLAVGWRGTLAKNTRMPSPTTSPKSSSPHHGSTHPIASVALMGRGDDDEDARGAITLGDHHQSCGDLNPYQLAELALPPLRGLAASLQRAGMHWDVLCLIAALPADAHVAVPFSSTQQHSSAAAAEIGGLFGASSSCPAESGEEDGNSRDGYVIVPIRSALEATFMASAAVFFPLETAAEELRGILRPSEAVPATESGKSNDSDASANLSSSAPSSLAALAALRSAFANDSSVARVAVASLDEALTAQRAAEVEAQQRTATAKRMLMAFGHGPLLHAAAASSETATRTHYSRDDASGAAVSRTVVNSSPPTASNPNAFTARATSGGHAAAEVPAYVRNAHASAIVASVGRAQDMLATVIPLNTAVVAAPVSKNISSSDAQFPPNERSNTLIASAAFDEWLGREAQRALLLAPSSLAPLSSTTPASSLPSSSASVPNSSGTNADADVLKSLRQAALRRAMPESELSESCLVALLLSSALMRGGGGLPPSTSSAGDEGAGGDLPRASAASRFLCQNGLGLYAFAGRSTTTTSAVHQQLSKGKRALVFTSEPAKALAAFVEAAVLPIDALPMVEDHRGVAAAGEEADAADESADDVLGVPSSSTATAVGSAIPAMAPDETAPSYMADHPPHPVIAAALAAAAAEHLHHRHEASSPSSASATAAPFFIAPLSPSQVRQAAVVINASLDHLIASSSLAINSNSNSAATTDLYALHVGASAGGEADVLRARLLAVALAESLSRTLRHLLLDPVAKASNRDAAEEEEVVDGDSVKLLLRYLAVPCASTSFGATSSAASVVVAGDGAVSPHALVHRLVVADAAEALDVAISAQERSDAAVDESKTHSNDANGSGSSVDALDGAWAATASARVLSRAVSTLIGSRRYGYGYGFSASAAPPLSIAFALADALTGGATRPSSSNDANAATSQLQLLLPVTQHSHLRVQIGHDLLRALRSMLTSTNTAAHNTDASSSSASSPLLPFPADVLPLSKADAHAIAARRARFAKLVVDTQDERCANEVAANSTDRGKEDVGGKNGDALVLIACDEAIAKAAALEDALVAVTERSAAFADNIDGGDGEFEDGSDDGASFDVPSTANIGGLEAPLPPYVVCGGSRSGITSSAAVSLQLRAANDYLTSLLLHRSAEEGGAEPSAASTTDGERDLFAATTTTTTEGRAAEISCDASLMTALRLILDLERLLFSSSAEAASQNAAVGQLPSLRFSAVHTRLLLPRLFLNNAAVASNGGAPIGVEWSTTKAALLRPRITQVAEDHHQHPRQAMVEEAKRASDLLSAFAVPALSALSEQLRGRAQTPMSPVKAMSALTVLSDVLHGVVEPLVTGGAATATAGVRDNLLAAHSPLADAAVAVCALLIRTADAAMIAISHSSPSSSRNDEQTTVEALAAIARRAAQIGFAVSPHQTEAQGHIDDNLHPIKADARPSSTAPPPLPTTSVALLEAYAAFVLSAVNSAAAPSAEEPKLSASPHHASKGSDEMASTTIPASSPALSAALSALWTSPFRACGALVSRHYGGLSAAATAANTSSFTSGALPELWQVLPPAAAATGRLLSSLAMLVASTAAASSSSSSAPANALKNATTNVMNCDFDFIIDLSSRIAASHRQQQHEGASQRAEGGKVPSPTAAAVPIAVSPEAMRLLRVHAIETRGRGWAQSLAGLTAAATDTDSGVIFSSAELSAWPHGAKMPTTTGGATAASIGPATPASASEAAMMMALTSGVVPRPLLVAAGLAGLANAEVATCPPIPAAGALSADCCLPLPQNEKESKREGSGGTATLLTVAAPTPLSTVWAALWSHCAVGTFGATSAAASSSSSSSSVGVAATLSEGITARQLALLGHAMFLSTGRAYAVATQCGLITVPPPLAAHATDTAEKLTRGWATPSSGAPSDSDAADIPMMMHSDWGSEAGSALALLAGAMPSVTHQNAFSTAVSTALQHDHRIGIGVAARTLSQLLLAAEVRFAADAKDSVPSPSSSSVSPGTDAGPTPPATVAAAVDAIIVASSEAAAGQPKAAAAEWVTVTPVLAQLVMEYVVYTPTNTTAAATAGGGTTYPHLPWRELQAAVAPRLISAAAAAVAPSTSSSAATTEEGISSNEYVIDAEVFAELLGTAAALFTRAVATGDALHSLVARAASSVVLHATPSTSNANANADASEAALAAQVACRASLSRLAAEKAVVITATAALVRSALAAILSLSECPHHRAAFASAFPPPVLGALLAPIARSATRHGDAAAIAGALIAVFGSDTHSSNTSARAVEDAYMRLASDTLETAATAAARRELAMAKSGGGVPSLGAVVAAIGPSVIAECTSAAGGPAIIQSLVASDALRRIAAAAVGVLPPNTMLTPQGEATKVAANGVGGSDHQLLAAAAYEALLQRYGNGQDASDVN